MQLRIYISEQFIPLASEGCADQRQEADWSVAARACRPDPTQTTAMEEQPGMASPEELLSMLQQQGGGEMPDLQVGRSPQRALIMRCWRAAECHDQRCIAGTSWLG